MLSHEGGDFFRGLDLGAHPADAPMLQHGAHEVDLIAVDDFTQLLLVNPNTGAAYGGHLGDQSVDVSPRILRRGAGAILEQRPAHDLAERSRRTLIMTLAAR